MAQEILNSSNNINIAHNVSLWFQRDFAGNYTEFGDLVVEGVALAPEFADHRSYRNGINALRKRLLTSRAASITATLAEPNIKNLERVLFGTVPASGESVTAFETKHLTVKDIGGGVLGIDMVDAGETDFANISVTRVYDSADVLEQEEHLGGAVQPDTDGHVALGGTDIALGDLVAVSYTITVEDLFSTEIFGATNATVEGAARLQARNLQGGVVQLWELASVNVAPNGDMTYPLDAVQTVPVLMSLQERAGTFGKVYTK